MEVERFIYEPLLAMYNIDLQETETALNWGAQDQPKFEVVDIFRAVGERIMSRKEARKQLAKLGMEIEGEDLPPELEEPTPTPTPTQGNGGGKVTIPGLNQEMVITTAKGKVYYVQPRSNNHGR